MATDRYFLEMTDQNPDAFTVRFYTWNPWCFSLGNAQNVERELKLREIEKQGYEVVRRMTGGRVVFHSEELTYSVIGPIHKGTWTESLASTYQRINEILLEGLQGAGFCAELERGEVTDSLSRTGANKPCFASTSRSELVYEGRKVVGSAQRRLRHAFLQHGSILTGSAHLNVSHFLKTDQPEHFKDQLEKNSYSLNLQKPVDLTALQTSLRAAFENAWGQPLATREITTLEKTKILDRVIAV